MIDTENRKVGGMLLFAVSTGGVPMLTQHNTDAAWKRAARKAILAGSQVFWMQLRFADNKIHIDYDAVPNASIVKVKASRRRG